MLHAGVADSRVWDLCTVALLRHRVRVIAYDRRGFGESSWQPECFSHVEDLWRVLDALDLPQVVLVGSSQGGRIALDAALQHPHRVAGLVLVGAAVTGAPPAEEEAEPHEARLLQVIEEVEALGDIDGVNRYEARLWLDGTAQPQSRVQDPARRLFLSMNGRALRAPDVGEAVWPPSAWDRLEEVAAKTLVLTGRYDLGAVNRRAHILAERIIDSLRWEFPRSAHLPMLDDPSTFAMILGEYLDLLGWSEPR
jgi:pimeloyl-ACP methyl ester carboxylesterase